MVCDLSGIRFTPQMGAALASKIQFAVRITEDFAKDLTISCDIHFVTHGFKLKFGNLKLRPSDPGNGRTL